MIALLVGFAIALLPGPVVPLGLGANLGFDDLPSKEVDLLHDTGFRWVRRDLFWHEVEREKGKYDFRRFDRLLTALRARRIRPVFILCYGNGLYQKDSPKIPEARAAFVRYAVAAVEHFRGKGVVWEMWNEPNGVHWPPAPNVEDYVKLALAVGKAIKARAPGETYVGPGLAGIDLFFLEQCFQKGLLRYWDAISVHPYRPMEPETAVEDYARVRALMDRYGGEKPILASEWGYSAANGLGVDRQADFFIRTYLTNLTAGVPLTIWYNWKDNGTDPKENEQNFGVRRGNLLAKPTSVAVGRLVQALSGYRYEARIALADPRDHLLLFGTGRSRKLAAWTTAREGRDVATPFGWRLRLTETPRYLDVPRPSAALDATVALPDLPAVSNVSEPSDIRRLLRGWPLGTRLWEDAPSSPVLLKDPSRLARFSDCSSATYRVRVQAPGTFAQEWVLAQADPLQADFLAPFGGEVRIQIRASRKPFRGRAVLRWAGESLSQAFVAGEKPSILTFPAQIGNAPMALSITDRKDAPRLTLPFQRAIAVDLSEMRVNIQGTDSVPGEARVKPTTLAPGLPVAYAQGHRIDFQFGKGWRYAMLVPKEEIALDGRPARYTAWVEGDGSGVMLLMRTVDASGQTFQPEGIAVDWKGWKLVSFPLDGSTGGRWGGANDGRPHLPMRLSAGLVLDNPGGRGVEGSIVVAAPTVFTEPHIPKP
ncbi:hypothetical protein BH11ARM2_BH11ARM2_38440 [soil metagenome]